MRSFVLLAIWLGALVGACDPVRDDAIAVLGPEKPGVPHGPLHRPGQPCLYCHDGGWMHPPRFTVAGTVFDTPETTTPVEGATVFLTDASGSTAQLRTNAAGNFYATPGQYDPTFPMQVTVQGPAGQVAVMLTLVQGNGTVEPNGACASCHFDPAGPSSPGHVCIQLADGGTPP